MRPAFLLCLLFLGCATAAAPERAATPTAPDRKPDPDAALRAEVEALRARVGARLKTQAELYWKTWSIGEAVEPAALEAGSDKLFTPAAIARVAELRARTADAAEARALTLLRRYLVSEYVARESSEPAAALAAALARAQISVDGEDSPLREAEVLLSGEAHAGRRRRIAEASVAALAPLEPLAAERDRRVAQALKAVGFGPLGFATALREADADVLAQLADDVLARTETAYLAALDELARRELRTPLAQLRRADLPRVMRTGEVDGYFPKAALVDGLRARLLAMGLGPAALPGLRIDAEARPRKSPRALALPVQIPGDVRLSLRPSDGLAAYAQTMHEAGHAVQYALVREPRLEFSLLAGPAPGELAAALFESLADHPALAAELGVPEPKLARHVRAGALRRLVALRRDAARVHCELAFFRDLADASATCQAALTRAYGFPADAGDVLRQRIERDPFLLAAERLRGAVLAAHLEEELVRTSGDRWWADARTGERLRALFAAGGSISGESLTSGLGGLSAESLARTYTARLTFQPAPRPAPTPAP